MSDALKDTSGRNDGYIPYSVMAEKLERGEITGFIHVCKNVPIYVIRKEPKK